MAKLAPETAAAFGRGLRAPTLLKAFREATARGESPEPIDAGVGYFSSTNWEAFQVGMALAYNPLEGDPAVLASEVEKGRGSTYKLRGLILKVQYAGLSGGFAISRRFA